MSCGGCAERGEHLARAGSAMLRGSWQEAASAASAAAVSARVDLKKAAGRVAQAAAAALAKRGGR